MRSLLTLLKSNKAFYFFLKVLKNNLIYQIFPIQQNFKHKNLR